MIAETSDVIVSLSFALSSFDYLSAKDVGLRGSVFALNQSNPRSSSAMRGSVGLERVLVVSDGLDQALKGIWWMPWRQEAMKDVARCEKPR